MLSMILVASVLYVVIGTWLLHDGIYELKHSSEDKIILILVPLVCVLIWPLILILGILVVIFGGFKNE